MAVVGTNPMTFEGPFTIEGGPTLEMTGVDAGLGTDAGFLSIDLFLTGTDAGGSSDLGLAIVVGPRRVARGMVGWRGSRSGKIDFIQGEQA